MVGFALLVQWGARKDNLYLLGVYDLFEEAVYKYSTVTSSVGAGSKANNEGEHCIQKLQTEGNI